MVKLYCSIVGEKRSVFSVRIDASEGVDDLMMAIALREKYEFAASKLQLFVAKKSDGTFIQYSDVEALTLDANGCPKGFAPMIPVKSIQFYLGENCHRRSYWVYFSQRQPLQDPTFTLNIRKWIEDPIAMNCLIKQTSESTTYLMLT